jgi:HEAT repeat protein
VPASVRDAVKLATLQCIQSPHREVRLAAASAACHVAIAEASIDASGWEEFFVTLVALAQQTHSDESCCRAEAALKCIGTIFLVVDF